MSETRRRGPAIAIGAVIVLLVGAVALVGGIGGGADTTTTISPDDVPGFVEPGEQLQLLPAAIDATLEVVTAAGGAPSDYVSWAPGAEPDGRRLPVHGSSAAFDAAADLVAIQGPLDLGRGSSTDLWVMPVAGDARFARADVISFAWHSDRPGGIAFTTPATGQGLVLFSADADPTTGSISNEATHGRIDAVFSLVAWGDWGFAVARPTTPSTWDLEILDRNGQTIRSITAAILAVEGGRFVLGPPTVPGQSGPVSLPSPERLVVVDHTLEAIDTRLDELDLPASPTWAVLDRTGTRLAVGELGSGGTTLTLADLAAGEVRAFAMTGQMGGVGFTQGNDLLLVQNIGRGQLEAATWEGNLYRLSAIKRTVLAVRP